jgi:hypothetical protein
MTDSVIMKYGDYQFDPVPLMNVTKEFARGKNQEITGITYRATLQGSVVAGRGVNSDGTGANGIGQVDILQDELIEGMIAFPGAGAVACPDEAQKVHGIATFDVKCGVTELWYATGVRVNSIDFDAGVWVDKSDYTIELEWDGTGLPGLNISDFTESWSISPAENTSYFDIYTINPTGSTLDYEERHVPTWNVTHDVSAVGKATVDSSGCVVKASAQVAAEDIHGYLGLDEEIVKGMCVLCFKDGVHAFNHSRSVERDEVVGSYSVSESWLVRPSGLTDNMPLYDDTYTVDIQKGTQAAVTSATIRGNIQGFQETAFCSGTDPCVDGSYNVASHKYENAKSGLQAAVARLHASYPDTVIYRRMNYFASGDAYRPFNHGPTEHTITHDPGNGAISYSFTYNDKPKLCGIDTIFENFTISDTNQSDKIAEIGVIGRASGPIIQSLGTTTARRRSVSIDLVVVPNLTDFASPSPSQSAQLGCGSGCVSLGAAPSEAANAVVASFDPASCGQELTSYKTEDTENWEPLIGKYSRRVGWVFTACPTGAGYTGV